MKEATGELNMTVVTILAIAAISAAAIFIFLPQIRMSIAISSACSASNGGNTQYTDNGQDDGSGRNGVQVNCNGNGQCTATLGNRRVQKTCEQN